MPRRTSIQQRSIPTQQLVEPGPDVSSLRRPGERVTSVCMFMGVLAIGVILHVRAFPPYETWEGKLAFSPVVSSASNLIGSIMVAYLYGVPYTPLTIGWVGLVVNVCVSRKSAGLYDWLQKTVAFISIFYVGIKYLSVNSDLITWREVKIFVGIFAGFSLLFLIWVVGYTEVTHEGKFNWTTIL
ncbi:unnamed protein product [Adineta ricciae]|uniref:Uncharacterized protein n=1 Tax=Adineta ricciae TaxID=249248 RepID=A0A815UQI9_ADIRI|nr:unnamed protein product [Adineta ricciae]CAF1522276.1 unnamed protein product [Adineta ricciae]